MDKLALSKNVRVDDWTAKRQSLLVMPKVYEKNVIKLICSQYLDSQFS